MNIDTNAIEAIVQQVMGNINLENKASAPVIDGEDGIFRDMDNAIEAAFAAQREYMMQPLALRYKIIAEIRKIMTKKENAETLAHMAVDETGMGNYEDKLTKQYLVSKRTPGMEDLMANCWTGDEGLTLLELSPFGVIGAICPTTNPNETIINNSIGMLAAGNAVVFAPHPKAIKTSIFAVQAGQ